MLNAQNFKFNDLSHGYVAPFESQGLHVAYNAPFISMHRNCTFNKFEKFDNLCFLVDGILSSKILFRSKSFLIPQLFYTSES